MNKLMYCGDRVFLNELECDCILTYDEIRKVAQKAKCLEIVEPLIVKTEYFILELHPYQIYHLMQEQQEWLTCVRRYREKFGMSVLVTEDDKAIMTDEIETIWQDAGIIRPKSVKYRIFTPMVKGLAIIDKDIFGMSPEIIIRENSELKLGYDGGVNADVCYAEGLFYGKNREKAIKLVSAVCGLDYLKEI